MTKEEALQKIKELQDYVEKMGAPKKKVTEYPSPDSRNLDIDGVWAASIFPFAQEGRNYTPKIPASMFLYDGIHGNWVDQSGEMVKGYLYWIPN